MEFIKMLIEKGDITLDELYEFIEEYTDKTVIDKERLELLENSFINHPG